jgi:hypothetical protein
MKGANKQTMKKRKRKHEERESKKDNSKRGRLENKKRYE